MSRTRTWTRTVRVVAVLAALLPGGCADDSDPPDDAPTSVPTSPSDPSQPPDATDPTDPFETPEPTEPEPGTPGARELVGVPEPGVEAGCWLLDGHLLLGVDDELVSSGQRIRVTGIVERNMATTCQQGIPFRVETAEALDDMG